MAMKVLVEHVESGEREERAVPTNGYCVVVDGRMELTNTQMYGNGTVVVTMKRRSIEVE